MEDQDRDLLAISFEIDRKSRIDFLVNCLRPALNELINSNLFNRWSLTLSKFKGEMLAYDINIFDGPSGLERQGYLNEVREKLAKKIKWDCVINKVAPLAYFEKRWGPGLGLSNHIEFETTDTQFVLDMLQVLDPRAKPSQVQMAAIASTIFHAKTFLVPLEDLSETLSNFILFVHRQPDMRKSQLYVEKIKMASKEIYKNSTDLQDEIKKNILGNWGEMSGVFSRYEDQFKIIGKRLREIPEESYRPNYSLAIWNNFQHWRFFRLGLENKTEAILCYLIATALEEGNWKI
jgi:hypothetical protein